jgi:hypothetical protein
VEVLAEVGLVVETVEDRVVVVVALVAVAITIVVPRVQQKLPNTSRRFWILPA